MNSRKFDVLYSDVGGVLGTNGWDTHLRQKIAAQFNVELYEMENRHIWCSIVTSEDT